MKKVYHVVEIAYFGKTKGYQVYKNNKPFTPRKHLLVRSKARAIVALLNK